MQNDPTDVPPLPAAQPSRYVYEHGVEVVRQGERWVYGAQPNAEAPDPTGKVWLHDLELVGVGPHLPGWPLRLRLPNEQRGFADALDAVMAVGDEHERLRDEAATEVGYYLGAVQYHCSQLAKAYVTLCRDAAWRLEEESFGATVGIQSYFEFGATLAAIRRAYDALRVPLSATFLHPRHIQPDTLFGLLNLDVIPAPLRSQLVATIDRAAELKTYRDRVMHYLPVDTAAMPANFQYMPNGGPLALTLPIPDKPKRGSYRNLRDGNRDALTFAWHEAAEVLRIAEAVYRGCADKLACESRGRRRRA